MANEELARTKPSVNVGTLGHTGHGKTTLAAAITKVLSKRSPNNTFRSYSSIEHVEKSSKELGISFSTADVQYQTVNRQYRHVDCAGHVNHIKSMIAGSPRLDGAILVISAPEGAMPQTREHVQLARGVGAHSIVVFLNKCDQVDDPELVELMEMEVRELLSMYQFRGDDVSIIRGSALGALNGEAQWEAKIDELMAAVDKNFSQPKAAIDQPFLIAIEDVYTFRSSISGSSTVITGSIERGKVKAGDEVEIVGFTNTQKTSITGIEILKKPVDEGVAGDKVALTLRGIDRDEIYRGMVLAKPGSIKPHTQFTCAVYMLDKHEGGRQAPFFNKFRPQFYFRVTDITGTIKLPADTEQVMPGDKIELEVTLIAPVAMEVGLRFAMREGGKIIGAGVVSKIIQ